MEITVKNLEIGDEILMSSSSGLKYFKIIELPRLSKTRVCWKNKTPLYVATKCLTSMNEIQQSRTLWNGQVYNWVEKKYLLDPENLNTQIKQDFNYKIMWLLKRNVF